MFACLLDRYDADGEDLHNDEEPPGALADALAAAPPIPRGHLSDEHIARIQLGVSKWRNE